MSIATEIQRLQTAKADIKTAIEEKGVEVGNGTIGTYAEKISKISSGEDLVKYADNIQFRNLNLFEKEEVILNLDNIGDLTNLCSAKVGAEYNNKTVKRITVNCPNQVTSMNFAFGTSGYYDMTLEHITLNVDTSKCTDWGQTFLKVGALKIIDGTPLNFSLINYDTSRTFSATDGLEEVRFVENSIVRNISFSDSANLSNDTVESVINGLADLTGKTTKTLTFHATVGAKLTDTQKATITAKNWTLAY